MAKKPAQPVTEAAPTPASEANYTVLARRYRPQTFEELVGHEAVAQALTNAIKLNRIGHAYLFTGTRGVGKTTLARVFAKCLNCEKGPTPTPCNVCERCRSITSGEDVDVIEIDAATHTDVENIRELRGNAQYRPVRSRFRIYIIDEVHMLSSSKSSFPALLKILEEPPEHVKFLFATTDPQKIPAPILSRCQRYELRGFSPERIQTHLAKIVAAENLQAEPAALQRIARRAKGSMRDAQSLLDQVLALGSGGVTEEQLHRLLGSTSEEHTAALAAAVVTGDAPAALRHLDVAEGQGAQMSELVDQLVVYWRDLMAVQVAGPSAPNLSIASHHKSALVEQAKGLSLDAILAGLDVLTTTRMRLRDNDHARTLVEMALVRLTRLKDLLGLPQLARMLASGASPTTATPTTTVTPTKTVAPPEGVKKNALTEEKTSLRAVFNATTTRPTPATGAGQGKEILPKDLAGWWAQVLAAVAPLLASELRSAGLPAIFGPNTLVLRFPANYNQQQSYCERHVPRLEQLLREVAKRALTLKLESVAPVVESVSEVPALAPRKNPFEAAEKEPLIRRAIEVLGAQIKQVDDGFGSDATLRREVRDEADEDAA